MSNDKIREIFLANGFTIKEGLTDLKPYVYAAARALIAELEKDVTVPDAWIVESNGPEIFTRSEKTAEALRRIGFQVKPVRLLR